MLEIREVVLPGRDGVRAIRFGDPSQVITEVRRLVERAVESDRVRAVCASKLVERKQLRVHQGLRPTVGQQVVLSEDEVRSPTWQPDQHHSNEWRRTQVEQPAEFGLVDGADLDIQVLGCDCDQIDLTERHFGFPGHELHRSVEPGVCETGPQVRIASQERIPRCAE